MTPEEISEANADEARDYAAELRAVPDDPALAFECGCAAVPTSWVRDGLTGKPVCKTHGRPLPPPPAMTPAERREHPFAAGLLDAERLLGGGT